MKEYTYKFATGETTTVEISDELFEELKKLDRKEESLRKKESRHTVSLDSFKYEGLGISSPSAEDEFFAKERMKELKEELNNLTETQIRRLEERLDGKSITEIAEKEGLNPSSVYESFVQIQQKFKNLKIF